eukprot:CAMPEP_0119423648 /NCGR_PEP_ID=MMETSP1335-20130426/30799_1 /TAXON_ID=259385 /ORGANISM="Chrysoculter rhomboideus, Strain RCC1486" /LENGTH=128 /DNA_ID=CAMNT_0007449141 /DNA_START=56 /DNA_END=439 /DNA_ORIENTATION=+
MTREDNAAVAIAAPGCIASPLHELVLAVQLRCPQIWLHQPGLARKGDLHRTNELSATVVRLVVARVAAHHCARHRAVRGDRLVVVRVLTPSVPVIGEGIHNHNRPACLGKCLSCRPLRAVCGANDNHH